MCHILTKGALWWLSSVLTNCEEPYIICDGFLGQPAWRGTWYWWRTAPPTSAKSLR